MRNNLLGISYPSGPAPSHLALAYDAWAPVAETGEEAGKVPVKTAATLGRPANERFREQWLATLEDIAIDGDYVHAFGRWEKSLKQSAAASCEIALTSRLLVGHGNASATEVGLTVHHTWGVPIIPGSALKGLCAHYTAATYGQQEQGSSARPPFSGPKWDAHRRRVETPPGDYYRALFGAADVDGDASAGLVTFHDALYIPRSGPGDKPFAVDVLTVHQRGYYGQDGQNSGEWWPNDYDSPNPVGFISVKPGAKFLLAVGGDSGWTGLALDLLSEAMGEWGVGGKTSAGYGRRR